MTETYVAERWLLETLNADTDVDALIDSRIYAGMAPEGRTSPFVLIQFVPSGIDLNAGEQDRIASYLDYLVEVIADAESYPHAEFSAVDAALHNQRETVNYGTVLDPVNWRVDCIRLRPHTQAYYTGPKQVRHSGGFFRVIVRPDCP